MAAPAQGGHRAALAFLQPVAMGVLLGQGWHVYSEVSTRGSLLGLGLCSAGVLLGLLAGVLLCARAAPGQAALRLSLFWMSCTLNGGLSAIAQLRHRIGRFHANDDALVVNSFLSSGLLGTSLPHVALKVARRPEAEVVMPCVLAVLVTEAICSNDAMPVLKVGISTFLFAVGIQGIATDSSSHGDAAASPAASSPGATDVSQKAVSVGGGSAHEPFFPTTVMESRRYSPRFMIGRRARCLPNGAGLVPLVSLVGRQAGPEPSRPGGRGKERAPRGQRQRPEEAPLSAAAAAIAQTPAVLGAADTSSAPAAVSSSCLRASEALRQRGVVGAADVGTDIRWDVILEEMRRVDGGKGAMAPAPEAPASPPVESCDLSDAPVEVFAELAEGDADLDDGIEAEGDAADGNADGEDGALRPGVEVAHTPLAEEEEIEGGDASGPASGAEPEPCNEEEKEEEQEEDVAPSSLPRPGAEESDEQVEPLPSSDALPSEQGPLASDAEELAAEAASAPSAQATPPPTATKRLPPGDCDGLDLDASEDEYDVPWLHSRAPMPVELDSSDDGEQEAEETLSSRWGSRRARARARDRGRGREREILPCLSSASAPSAGLPLIEVTDHAGASPSEECDQLSLDVDMPDPAGRVSFLPTMQMSPKAVAGTSLRAAAEEFVPVEACSAPGGVATAESASEAHLRQALRADAQAFRPGSDLAAAAAGAARAPGGEEPADPAGAPSSTASKAVAEPSAAPEATGATEWQPSKGLKLKLFPESLDLASSDHRSGGGLATTEQPKLGFASLDYHGAAARAGVDDRWSTPFGGEWGPASASVPMHDGGGTDELAADKKAFDCYGYPAGVWDEYAAYGGSMPADEWGAYGAYGGGTGAAYSQAGYDYEAGAGALGEHGPAGFLSASAAEFVPGGWSAEGQLPVNGVAEVGGQEPVASLMDPELPDPGLGRASAVRRGDSGPDVQQARGKKGVTSTSRTLWVGDVEHWMSEGYISDLFADMALVTDVKITRERKGGFSTGSALVELASESAAVGVLEAVGGEPILAKDGCHLRVSWANSDLHLADAGYEWPTPWDTSAQGRGAEGRETRSERRARRERDRGDGRGVPGRGEGGGHAESSGGRRGRKGEGAGWDGGLEAEVPQRRRGDGRADAHSEARGEGGRGRGRGRSDRGQDDSGEACWAYVDPNDQVQVGFTTEDMRRWHELGYFDGDLRIALMRCSPSRAKHVALPPRREFYPLRQWFPDPAQSFTYIPNF